MPNCSPGAISRTVVICLILGALVSISILLLLPRMGRIDKRSELVIRIANLRLWHGRVQYFTKKIGKTPDSLYTACIFDRSFKVPYLKVGVAQDWEDDARVFDDPNVFSSQCEYTLLIGSDSWFVIERNPGKYYKRFLLINDEGSVFELRER